MKNISAKIIFLLILISFFYSESFPQQIKLSKRVMTNDEFVKLKKHVGTYEEGKNYNQIINGHGTGLKPPTEEQWKEMKNQQLIIDKIDYPLQKAMIPSSCDNSATVWFPPIGNQGLEGSCVSWACAYYVKTFQEAREHNWDLSGCTWSNWEPSVAYQDKIFSPDFVYHQVNNGGDNGSTFSSNMDLLEQIGCCTWDRMPYKSSDHTTWPSENAWRQAPLYRSQTGYGYMPVDTDLGIEDLKQLLANGNLAVINIDAAYFGENFTPEDLWTLDNYPGGGGHANTIVGYDDNFGPYTESGSSNKYGAFKVANSWGISVMWENISDGFYYISYECMKQRIQWVCMYENFIDYKPKMVAVFEMNQSRRGENLINIGKGNTTSPAAIKSFNHRLYTGGTPYPNNPMVVDITEFIPYMSGSNDQFFIQVYNEGGLGTIQYFAIEMYDDYSSGIPTRVYTSTETPQSTQQNENVFANVFTSEETIIITYPSGGEKFEVGSNPIITYTSYGTSGHINLDYSTNAGTTWNTIADNVEDNGSYSGWTVPNTPSANCKIKISDVDGNPSVISKGLIRLGPCEFTEQTSINLTGVSNSSVAWGDYDNDGDLDIVLTGWNGNNPISKIYSNNGNNTFKEETSISLVGVFHSLVKWGDYDNDGDLDILLCGIKTNGDIISTINRNNGNNTFTELTSISLAGVQDGSADWADYDNDGDLDILLTGSSESGPISKIYKNNGNNAFTEQTSISLTDIYACSAAWGDYDNDGDLDILLTGWCESGYISKIYRNNGNNTFTEQ
ncbi:MAG TPA: FG-GAP-like repeat-containing protein, partial [Ignavibacteriaceae bacterium]|nr:FG-GAP-like repeat-containing protein [Ignavibacteriaceae bacterium]